MLSGQAVLAGSDPVALSVGQAGQDGWQTSRMDTRIQAGPEPRPIMTSSIALALPDPAAADGPSADAPAAAPSDGAATPETSVDPGAVFDRLGLGRRSSTLLAESERLRGALAPLVQPVP